VPIWEDRLPGYSPLQIAPRRHCYPSNTSGSACPRTAEVIKRAYTHQSTEHPFHVAISTGTGGSSALNLELDVQNLRYRWPRLGDVDAVDFIITSRNEALNGASDAVTFQSPLRQARPCRPRRGCRQAFADARQEHAGRRSASPELK
jgi:hypothetical protein